MVRAWYLADDNGEDQRLEHHLNPPHFVPVEQLKELSGVQYWKVSQRTERINE
jgi:1,2-dihydroxy-3-keto-5-methylthiopentene dioxygenase